MKGGRLQIHGSKKNTDLKDMVKWFLRPSEKIYSCLESAKFPIFSVSVYPKQSGPADTTRPHDMEWLTGRYH